MTAPESDRTPGGSTTTLAIIERSHRGTVEQQYAHVLWLVHGLSRQTPMTVLLRSMAAVYALDTPPPDAVPLGGKPWGATPDYRAALARLSADGVRVLVSASSLATLGLADHKLLPDIIPVSDAEVVEIAGSSTRIWYL